MGRRRKSNGAGALILLVMIFGIAAGYGLALLILGGVIAAIWLARKILSAASQTSSGRNTRSPAPAPPLLSPPDDKFWIYRTNRADLKTDPRPFWVDADTHSTVQGRSIGGMIYVGKNLASLAGGDVEPALIDPNLPAASKGLDLSERRTGYWPSYSTCSPEARGAYLQWLSSGRKDPNADVGLVFLYFYGLERRALADPLTVQVPAIEIEAIKMEVERLVGIYASGSFQNYAHGFLDLLQAKSVPNALYREPPPPSSHLSLRHKIGLAQCAQDGMPLTVDWAIAWLENDTSGRLPTAAIRCRPEFRRLFAIRYAETYGEGLILPKNRTKLRFDYHAASASFHGWNHSPVYGLDLPDVTVLTSPVKKLRAVAERCCEDLSRYSRRHARAEVDPDSLECIAELPYPLWPEKYRSHVEKIRALVTASGQPLAIPFETVRTWMPSHTTLGKPQWQRFVGRLAEAGLGVEPDPSAGGPAPTTDTRIAFFSLGTERRADEASGRYRAAALTLQLALAVAGADGVAQDVDRSGLIGSLEEWMHLTPTEKARLGAHLRRVLAEAPKVTGLTRQVKAIDRAARKAVGTFVISVAQADGVVTKAERKMLDRIFKLLELDPATLPPVTPEEPRVVVVASEPATIHPIRQPAQVFVLDPNRIRELQAETERVAKLLTGIFNSEEDAPAPAPQAPSEPPEPRTPVAGLWGLDPEHSDLARKLLGRAHWTRAELEELAEDRQIMLDGALETINEACLDTTGQPMLEGSDPIEVNRDLVHSEQAA